MDLKPISREQEYQQWRRWFEASKMYFSSYFIRKGEKQMARFGKVIFKRGGERGAQLQRTLAERLREKGVIDADDETIQKWYEEDLREPVGSVHTYLLHNSEQADIFRSIMESPEMTDPSIKWKVTSFCRDKEFIRWMEQTERNAR